MLLLQYPHDCLLPCPGFASGHSLALAVLTYGPCLLRRAALQLQQLVLLDSGMSIASPSLCTT